VADRGEWARRKRWEREVLRDGLRYGNWRAPPDAAWLPGEDVLTAARGLLKDGGCEGSTVSVRGDRLSAVVALPGSGAGAEEAGDHGAEAVLLPTDSFGFGGSPRRVRAVADAFGGPVVAAQLPGDEAEIAVLAALGVPGVLAVPLPDVDLVGLASMCRDYGRTLWVAIEDRASRDAALRAEATIVVWRLGEADDGAALERSCRLTAGIDPGVEVVGAGATSLQRALALRRAGADGALLPARLLDCTMEELAPADEPEIMEDPLLAEALLSLGADPTSFSASASGLLLMGGQPKRAPVVVEESAAIEEPRGPVDLLRVRRPLGLRL